MKSLFDRFARVRLGTYTRSRTISFVLAMTLLTRSSPASALEPPPPKGGPKITTGIALMAMGMIAAGFGGAIYIANENSGKTSCTACAKSSWVLPTVLMGLGGAMFVTGGTVLTIGLVEKTRGSTPTATLHLGPLGGAVRVQF